jgi:hypothetical protein
LRRPSSRATFWYKCVFPALWISGFTAGTVGLFAGGFRDEKSAPPPPGVCWAFLGATVVGTAFLYWTCIRLKAVWLEDGWLCLSNYLRTKRVSLSDIEEVREWRWINIHPVTVRFARDTGLGRSIDFMPPLRRLNRRPHPVADELGAMAAAAREQELNRAQAGPDN